MESSKEFLKLSKNKQMQKAKGELYSVSFVNDGYNVIYVPSLNISAYGTTHAEAYSMLHDIVIPDFFDQLLKLSLNEIHTELFKFGWEKSPFFKMELSKTAHIDKEGILKDFHLAEDTKFTEALVTV